MIILENKSFYNNASLFYDEMIDFEKNLYLRKEALKKIFPSKEMAIDLGSGTGLDSIALTLAGHKVLAVEPSVKMIEKAKLNAENYKAELNFLESAIHNIPTNYNEKFNVAVSLGNTFANVEGSVIYTTIQRIYELLSWGGSCLIHILNYSLLIERQERIVSIKQNDTKTFVRFYDFFNGQINFNILQYLNVNPKEHSLITTKIFGYKYDLLAKVFDSVGFVELKYWENLNQEPFNSESSKDLYIYAKKL